MERRGLLQMIAAGAAGLTSERQGQAQEKVAQATRGMPSPKIKDVIVIATQPAGARLTVVKIVTDQDGLYGYGCATFTQRADLVGAAVEKYLRPLLIGKPADRIEDTWQACYNSSYWRNGPVLNNAISGVDEALWDIKGRQAGLPVYELLGRQVPRGGRTATRNAGGDNPTEVVEGVRQAMARGYHHVRVQVGVPGDGGIRRGAAGPERSRRPGLHDGPVFDRAAYLRRTLQTLRGVPQRARRRSRAAARRARARSRRAQAMQFVQGLRDSSSCSFSRIRSRPRTSTGSGRSGRSARRRSRWASCSTARTSGRRSSRSV